MLILSKMKVWKIEILRWSLLQGGPLAVINGVINGPYKWPKINSELFLFHPSYSGVSYKPSYNW